MAKKDDLDLLMSYVNICRMNSRYEDVKTLCWVSDYDVLIIFNDDTMYIYDTFLNMYRIIRYKTPELTEEEWRFEFGRRLHDILQRKCITETDFAKMLKIQLPALNRYIRGKITPNAYMLNKILTILDIRADELLFVQYILLKYLKEEKEDV